MQLLGLGLLAMLILWGVYLLLLSSRIRRLYRGKMRKGARDALIWGAIFGSLVTACAFPNKLKSARGFILTELIPGYHPSSSAKRAWAKEPAVNSSWTRWRIDERRYSGSTQPSASQDKAYRA